MYLPVKLEAHALVGTFFIPVNLIAVAVGGIIVFGVEDDVGVVRVEGIDVAAVFVFVVHAKVSIPLT